MTTIISSFVLFLIIRLYIQYLADIYNQDSCEPLKSFLIITFTALVLALIQIFIIISSWNSLNEIF
jgi:hypothetical protein